MGGSPARVRKARRYIGDPETSGPWAAAVGNSAAVGVMLTVVGTGWGGRKNLGTSGEILVIERSGDSLGRDLRA